LDLGKNTGSSARGLSGVQGVFVGAGIGVLAAKALGPLVDKAITKFVEFETPDPEPMWVP
jgi:hypothetical protein